MSVNTKKWLKAAAVRAVRTMAQTFLASVGSATVLGSVDWVMLGSATALSGMISLATSAAGLPEVPVETEKEV
ncbi:MAG TPA: hypothetical protein IAB44_13775 [Candidatus Limivivens intestinipullorum]|uniref:Holin n=1 Tax=Candidatus Limivivens intestinipullorum TaxID=2840858 RepID=A0A9D1EVM8_9FIRM|nr:hypothetical protein [Candidatus Limivivens intestinipullorum]